MLIKRSCVSLLFGILMAGEVLTDVCAVLVHTMQTDMPTFTWLIWMLVIRVTVLAICAWYAGRLLTRPLASLTSAANDLGPDLKARMLAEDGPAEMAGAAHAFNSMQRRMAGHMAERVEILAAISHDLQTPITRMRLRTESMDSTKDRIRFLQDLDAMSALVREGVTYGRALHGTAETPRRIDARALLESLVADYEDSGQDVILEGRFDEPIVTLPNALRRILMNLVDNALKFASTARIRVQVDTDRLVIAVLDNGPGISPDQLEAVFKPFYRGERGIDPNIGGSGLGLAIARQLAVAMGAELSLFNRAEGGLEARLSVIHRPACPNRDSVARKGAIAFTRGRDEPVASG